MGEIDKRGEYTNKIPFSSYPEAEGNVLIYSNNKKLNDFLEEKIRKLLRDIYYGDIEEFDL